MRRSALAVGGLVVVALALRALLLDQSLYGDELYTHYDVADRSFGAMWDRVESTEDTPPLFFALAWLGAKVGDPTDWGIRLPSILAACATVPLLYGVGALTVGRRAALLGSAIFAVSPFAVFYGSEARAYSVMAFFVVLATYAVLRAVEADGVRWWALFAASSACALYSHLTAAGVIVVLVGWALVAHPERRRPAAVAAAAAALAVAPWLVLGPEPTVAGFEVLYPFDADHAAKAIARAAVGHPLLPLRDLPGRLSLALLVLVGIAVAAALLETKSRRPSPGIVLLVLATVVTPVGAALYSAVEDSIFAPRNLYASVPAGCLLAATVVDRAGRLRVTATVAIVVLLAIAAVRVDSPDHRRPPFDDVAANLDHRPGRIVVLNLYPVPDEHGRTPLLDSLRIYLGEPDRATEVAAGDRRALDVAAAGSARLHVVVEQLSGLSGDPPAPAAPRGYRLLSRTSFRGLSRIAVFTFGRS